MAIDTHNITVHTIRLSLKESCLKIDVKNVPILAGRHLVPYPKSGSCGSRQISLLIFLLFVLGTSQSPSCLCPEEVPLFFCLDGEQPSSVYIISLFDLSQINKIENFVVNPRFCILRVLLQQTVCNILLLLELRLLSLREIFFLH